jgi:Domain of unknown function (DUF4440)
MKLLLIAFIGILCQTNISAQSLEKTKDEVWQRELQYWKYVEQNDKANYLSLWHENFIGYPSTDSLTGKNHIADWIADLQNKKGLHYEYILVKKVVNPFGDVVITFYDELDIWKNEKNEAVSKETYKITHTWKKFGDNWLIIGGMSALKKE